MYTVDGAAGLLLTIHCIVYSTDMVQRDYCQKENNVQTVPNTPYIYSHLSRDCGYSKNWWLYEIKLELCTIEHILYILCAICVGPVALYRDDPSRLLCYLCNKLVAAIISSLNNHICFKKYFPHPCNLIFDPQILCFANEQRGGHCWSAWQHWQGPTRDC